MKLVNLKMSKEEAKEYSGPPSVGNAPEYPYGLCICLNDDSLQKLGITKLPAVGSVMLISAKVVVSGVRSSTQQDGDSESSVDLQITDMGLAGGKASSLYDNSDMNP